MNKYGNILMREQDLEIFWTKNVWTSIKVEDMYQNLKGKNAYKNSVSLQDRD